MVHAVLKRVNGFFKKLKRWLARRGRILNGPLKTNNSKLSNGPSV